MYRSVFDWIVARLKERDDIIRESWVRAMEAKIVRENINECYRLEGVNHLEKCKDLVDRYAVMLKENKVCILRLIQEATFDSAFL